MKRLAFLNDTLRRADGMEGRPFAPLGTAVENCQRLRGRDHEYDTGLRPRRR